MCEQSMTDEILHFVLIVRRAYIFRSTIPINHNEDFHLKNCMSKFYKHPKSTGSQRSENPPVPSDNLPARLRPNKEHRHMGMMKNSKCDTA